MAAGDVDDYREILDRELVDHQGRRCGRIDKLEWRGGYAHGREPTAILCGPGAWSTRLPGPARRLTRRLFGDEVVRVPWSHVKEVKHAIHLDASADDLGLGGGDKGVVKRFIDSLPGHNR